MFKTFVLSLAFVAIFTVTESRGVSNKPNPGPVLEAVPRPRRLIRKLHFDQCEFVTQTDCLNKGLPRGKYICAQIPEEHLRERLQKLGGLNPLYTAMNKTDAEKFKDPRWFFNEKPPTKKLPDRNKCKNPKPPRRGNGGKNRNKKPIRDEERNSEQQDDGMSFMNPEHGVLQDQQVNDVKDDHSHTPYKEMHQEDPELESEQNLIISKRAGSQTQSCWKRGILVKGSSSPQRYHLCGECHVVTTLDDDVIPRIINEASCKHGLPNGDPFKDYSIGNDCAWNSGLCEQRVIHFPALRLVGYDYDEQLSTIYGTTIFVEKWAEFTKEVKAGCQCQMFLNQMNVLKQLASP